MAPVLLLLAAGALLAQPAEYRIEPGGDNQIALDVEKTGLMKGKKHHFVFPRYQGKLVFDAGNPSNSRVELKIDSASVVCHDTWLSPKDLKKVIDYTLKDMLAVRQYPEMRFQSSKVTALGNNRFTVDGTLTIRGIGKPATLDVTLESGKLLFDGKSVVKLTNYGLKPPSAGLGTVGTKDEMTALFRVAALGQR
ncbi:MAG: YceI family protein [Acidobacteria bacterium]|nr:YceI family protein [Acidobacteriota bacterium]